MGASATAGLGAWIIVAASWACEAPTATEIFRGVTYGCHELKQTEEGSGAIHWVRIDLTTPGIELYVTPLDATAVEHDRQYRLRRIKEVVRQAHLAVAINGTYFGSDSNPLIRLPGDFARSMETVVADHEVSHFSEKTYLLWFDDKLAPHLRASKPPTAEELAAAKWGIGGGAVGLEHGDVLPGGDRDRSPDSRTAVAIDGPHKILFLAIGEYISPHRLLQELADLGATDGMLLDGGGSSSMAIGEAAKGVAPGRYGGWRPVATQFGVRAQPMRR
jgi:hypothetical protein